MVCTTFQSSHLMLFHQYPQFHKPHLKPSISRSDSLICCGLRVGPRKTLWKSRVLSKEAIQAVQSLKLAKSSPKLDDVFNTRISRLLMGDLLDSLAELQRQNELDLALKVFEFVRKELWYKPDISLYCGMIQMYGKHKMIEMVEQLVSQLTEEGLQPDTRAYTEVIGAYLQVDNTQKAIEVYELMKASGCDPDKLTLTILIRNLEMVGEDDLVAAVKRDVDQYIDSPEEFLEEVAKKYPKRKRIDLV